jgi:penicillin-binding protein 1A
VRTSLDPQCQADADQALRAGRIAYDRRHGWRGPVTHIPVTGDWRAPRRTLPAGRSRCGGLDAGRGVVHGRRAGVAIGLADGTWGRIPFDELKWARPTLADQRVGPVPHSATDVVKAGDVVLVALLAPGDAASLACAKSRRCPVRSW